MAKLIMVVAALMMMMMWSAASDISSDQAECTNQLVGLSTCLPYVQGNAKTPTPDCCNGLKEVLSKSPKCLCVLIKDRDDPHLGIKINVSLALALPDSCSVPARIYECPKLLKLPPNSTEAQIFMQPRKAVHGGAANETATVEGNNSTVAHETSDGVSRHMGKREWLRVEKHGEFLSLLVLPLLML